METKFRVFSCGKSQRCEHVLRVDRFLCFDAYRFRSCAFVLSPFSESPRHHNQNLSSSFFSEEGFLPAKEAPGISSSVRMTVSESRLEEAIFVVSCDAWPTKVRFHVFETRPVDYLENVLLRDEE